MSIACPTSFGYDHSTFLIDNNNIIALNRVVVNLQHLGIQEVYSYKKKNKFSNSWSMLLIPTMTDSSNIDHNKLFDKLMILPDVQVNYCTLAGRKILMQGMVREHDAINFNSRILTGFKIVVTPGIDAAIEMDEVIHHFQLDPTEILHPISKDPLHQATSSEETNNPERVIRTKTEFIRNRTLADHAKWMHNYQCQLCNTSLRNPDGSPYVEVHHRVPLSLGGTDSLDNLMVLCPNCHTTMHLWLCINRSY